MASIVDVSAHNFPTHTLVQVTGEIDLSNTGVIYTQLKKLAQAAPILYVDLSNLSFLDSAGLSTLDRLADDLAQEGRELKLIATPGCIARRVLEMSGMDTVFTLVESI